jgi:hypothetical protein
MAPCTRKGCLKIAQIWTQLAGGGLKASFEFVAARAACQNTNLTGDHEKECRHAKV